MDSETPTLSQIIDILSININLSFALSYRVHCSQF